MAQLLSELLTPALLLEVALLCCIGLGVISILRAVCELGAGDARRDADFRLANNIPHRPHAATTKAHAKETR